MNRTAFRNYHANRIFRSAVCVVSIGLCSCVAHHGVLVADVDPLDWLPGDTVSVAYANTDTTGLYDLRVLVRYNDRLPAGPLPLQIETFTPDSTAFRETAILGIPLRDPKDLAGRNPTFFEYEIPYRTRVQFLRGGIYRFRFAPASRTSDPLAGITAAGIRITPISGE